MKYRSDIDGLRAIAVLAVVFSHVGFQGFAGGYVGVDVFFVISGFLITSIILEELKVGEFSIIHFYERRIRRILPVLFVVLATTLAVGYWALLPLEYYALSKSAVATIFFASNIYFWRTTGYFSEPAEFIPLLHTWSLAVEEQFYLLWPIFLILGYHYFRKFVPAFVIAIAVFSFLLSWYGIAAKPTPTFYLLPTRMWELMSGCVLALGMLPTIKNKTMRELAAFVGLLLICLSVLTFTPKTPFPGPNALFPCLGALLIIWAGMTDSTAVGRMLSLKPMVFVGLISYSLYLWHWPVLVISKTFASADFELFEKLSVVAVAFVLAIISYVFIETPIRRHRELFTLNRLATGLTLTASGLVAAGVIGIITIGIPARFSPHVAKFEAAYNDYGFQNNRCHNIPIGQVNARNLCKLGAGASAETFILLGDSHAAGLAPGFAKLAEKFNQVGLYASRDSCPPLVGVSLDPVKGRQCGAFNTAMFDLILKSPARDIVLVSRWNLYANGWPSRGIESHEKNDILIVDKITNGPSIAENKQVLARGLARTIATLEQNGKRIWIVHEVPYVGYHVPKTLARHFMRGKQDRIHGPSKKLHDEEAQFVRNLFKPLTIKSTVSVLDPSVLLCDSTFCRVKTDDRAFYRDDDHLTRSGASYLLPIVEPLFHSIAHANERSKNWVPKKITGL